MNVYQIMMDAMLMQVVSIQLEVENVNVVKDIQEMVLIVKV